MGWRSRPPLHRYCSCSIPSFRSARFPKAGSRSLPSIARRRRLVIPPPWRKTAKLLVTAQNPVVIADALVRRQTGMDHLVALAETMQAPVTDRYSRLNMPAGHYLNQTERGRALISEADVILGLELTDPWGVVNTLMDRIDRPVRRVAKPGMKMIRLTTHDFLIKTNFQNFHS